MTLKKLENTLPEEISFKEIKKYKNRITLLGKEAEIKDDMFNNMLSLIAHRLAENPGMDPYEIYIDTAESGFLTKTDSILALVSLFDKDKVEMVKSIEPELHKLEDTDI